MTATTLTGALKAALAPLEPTVAVYRDRAPEVDDPATLGPWFVIAEAIDRTRTMPGDRGDTTAPVTIDETVQADLYQRLRAVDGTVLEDPALPDRLRHRLDNLRLTDVPGEVALVTVLADSRFPDTDANLVRHQYRLRITRTLPTP